MRYNCLLRSQKTLSVWIEPCKMIGTFLLSWFFSVNGPLQIIRICHCLFQARFLQEFGIGSAQHNLVPSCRSTCVCLMFNKGKFTPNTIYCDRSVPRSAETGNFPTALPYVYFFRNFLVPLHLAILITVLCLWTNTQMSVNAKSDTTLRVYSHRAGGRGGSESGHR